MSEINSLENGRSVLSEAWNRRRKAFIDVLEIRDLAMRASAERLGVEFLRFTVRSATFSYREFEERFQAGAQSHMSQAPEVEHLVVDKALLQLSRLERRVQLAIPYLPQYESVWRETVESYALAEQAYAACALENPEVCEDLEGELGPRPLGGVSAKLWEDGARALLAEHILVGRGDAIGDGRRFHAARRLQRARFANGYSPERPEYPTFTVLDSELRKVIANLRRLNQRPPSDPELRQTQSHLGLIKEELNDMRDRAMLFAIYREPEALADVVGRPADSPEELSLWAPAAAALIEARELLGPAQFEKADAGESNDALRPAYRRFAEASARYVWWKAPSDELVGFRSRFDLFRSSHFGDEIGPVQSALSIER